MGLGSPITTGVLDKAPMINNTSGALWTGTAGGILPSQAGTMLRVDDSLINY